MSLLEFISDHPRRRALATACGTSPKYLWQVATNWRGRRASADLAERIEIATAKLGPFTVPKETVIFGPSAKTTKKPAQKRRKRKG